MRELLKKAALSMLLLGLMAVLLWQNGAVGQAVRQGLALCARSVIPALFPFIVVSSLLVSLGAGRAARILERPFRALFRCGGAGADASETLGKKEITLYVHMSEAAKRVIHVGRVLFFYSLSPFTSYIR